MVVEKHFLEHFEPEPLVGKGSSIVLPNKVDDENTSSGEQKQIPVCSCCKRPFVEFGVFRICRDCPFRSPDSAPANNADPVGC